MENSSEKAPAYSYYALAVLMFVYVMNFLDRQIIYILFPLIKKEMAFSDTQLALLGGTAPLIATAIFAATGHWFLIAVFMTVNAVIAMIAVYFSKYFRSDADQGDDERFDEDTTGSIRVVGSRQPRASKVAVR